jgi:probable HAF family extracellular repeat protein
MRLMRGLLTAALLLTGFASAQVFTLTDIGPQIWPTGINSRGQVSAYGFCCGLFEEQAILWSKKNGIKALAASLDGTANGAIALNDYGDLVGWSLNGGGNPDAVLWPHRGGIFDFPGTEDASQANAINNAGQVAGTNFNTPGFGDTTLFFWSAKTGLVDIVTTSDESTGNASAISASGTVVGFVGTFDNPSSFIWKQETGMKFIPLPSSYATGIHKEFVVGSGACLDPRPCGAYHAYIWSHYGSFDLGTLRGDTSSAASAINSSLQIVGMSLNASGRSTAFFWKTRYPMMDLNKLVHAPGWQLMTATGINDCSQIVGYGTLNGVEHGFLLTVIPRKGHH